MGLGGPDDELGARGLGEPLALVAVAGVDDVDVGAGVAQGEVLAGDLVDDDGVGGREQLGRADREQAGVTGPAADEGDARGDAGGGSGG